MKTTKKKIEIEIPVFAFVELNNNRFCFKGAFVNLMLKFLLPV